MKPTQPKTEKVPKNTPPVLDTAPADIMLAEVHREYMRFRRLAFPEEEQDYIRLWRLARPELRAKHTATWRKTHPNANLNWQRANSAKCQSKNSERRAKLLKARIGARQIIARIYARAAELRQWFDVVVDHIVPLAKGGAHEPGNLQIIYRSDNLKKHARLDFQPRVIFT